MRTPFAASLALVLALAPLCAAQAKDLDKVPADEVLDTYVQRAQPAYKWTLKSTERQGDITVHKIELVSQTWQGMTWTHRLNVMVPTAATGDRARPGHALLGISGTGGEREHIAILGALARDVGVPVAVLHDVPNQPLFKEETKNGRGLKEDALIATTFVKFNETGDREWLALLPMTRAVVSAMDCLAEFSRAQTWAFGELTKFVTLGGSKRGWTTWLSAVVDRRVIGIAPIVYDNLDIPRQIALHMDTWGHPSPSIHDYTDRGLMKLLQSPRGDELLAIVDPYSYRHRLTVPKLAIIGTNDTYWPLESIHLYRGALPGETFTHYVPNGGHRVGPTLIQAVSGFFDHVTGRIEGFPDVHMTIIPRDSAHLRVAGSAAAERILNVRLWGSQVDGRDFTKSKWVRVPATRAGDEWTADLPEACTGDLGRAAFIGEFQIADSAGKTFTIHTSVQVWELGPAQ
jgi:PhoPQ-activated pathogenicity-related protein